MPLTDAQISILTRSLASAPQSSISHHPLGQMIETLNEYKSARGERRLAYLPEDDPREDRYAHLSERPDLDDLNRVTFGHCHLIEYHLGKIVSDIPYKHPQPAQWAQGDVVSTWRDNYQNIHIIKQPPLVFKIKLPTEYWPGYDFGWMDVAVNKFEVHSFGTVIRSIEIHKCDHDCFTLEGFEKWRNNHGN